NRRPSLEPGTGQASADDLIEWILHDSYRTGLEQLGEQLTDGLFRNHGLDGEPFLALEIRVRVELRHGRGSDGRKQLDNVFQVFTGHVHFEADPARGIERTANQYADLPNLRLLPAVVPCLQISAQ